MTAAGFSPSVRLLQAASLGISIPSDHRLGLESFLKPGEGISTARSGEEALSSRSDMTGESGLGSSSRGSPGLGIPGFRGREICLCDPGSRAAFSPAGPGEGERFSAAGRSGGDAF